MALFTWNLRYAIEVPHLDAEHARLFALADRLHAAIAQGDPRESVRARLASLVKHSRDHFAHEEQLMIGCGYPEFERHRAQHEDLMARVVQFQCDFAAERAALRPEMLRFLKDWLSRHIDEYDRPVAVHLNFRRKVAATMALC